MNARSVLVPIAAAWLAVGVTAQSAPENASQGVAWSTFVGGNAPDRAFAIAVDPSGLVTVAGFTRSGNFPGTGGPAGGSDVFVSRFDPHQTGAAQLLWSTLIGGSNDDIAYDLVIDGAGNAFVTGLTESSDFPATTGQVASGGGIDAFVAKLDPSGAVTWASYFGGTGNDAGLRVAVDDNGLATIAGYSDSTDLATSGNAEQPANAGGQDAFVAQVDAAGTWSYSTYLGGPGNEGPPVWDWGFNPVDLRKLGLALDAQHRVALTGRTPSVFFPTTPNAYDTSHNGNEDAFVSVLDPSQPAGGQLVYSTFLGVGGSDGGWVIAVAPDGQLVVGGGTDSGGFPVSPGALQPVLAGNNDGFVAWLDPTATGTAQLTYATFFGGELGDGIMALAVDARGHVTIGGFTNVDGAVSIATTAGATQVTGGGLDDAFVARIAPDGAWLADLTYATLLGDVEPEVVLGLALDGTGGVFVAGGTRSSGLPIGTGGFQPSFNGGILDAWAAQLDLLPSNVIRFPEGSGPHCGGAVLFEAFPMPAAGGTFVLEAGNAPPAAAGALLFGGLHQCVPILGANLCVSALAFPVVADGFGTLTIPLAVPVGTNGAFAVQAVFATANSCAPPPLSSTAALVIGI